MDSNRPVSATASPKPPWTKILALACFLEAGLCIPFSQLTQASLPVLLILNIFAQGLFLLPLYLIWRKCPGLSGFTLTTLGVLLALGLIIRFWLFDHLSGDYVSFLSHWVTHLREAGGFSGLASVQSDYNMPYLYLLAFFSQLPFPDLYAIKMMSLIADAGLLVTAVYILHTLTLSGQRVPWAAMVVFLAPTVLLNGAYWGQCDAVYTFLVLLTLYSLLSERYTGALIWYALAFSFKLQAIFFAPVLFLFLLLRKFNLRSILACLLTYFATLLPAVLLGKPLESAIGIYSNQVSQYSAHLNLNSPSVFALLPGDYNSVFFFGGLIAAAGFTLFLIQLIYRYRANMTSSLWLYAAFLFCLGMPYFLPSMHDRYFFIADVLAILTAAAFPSFFWVPPLVVGASLAGYLNYFNGIISNSGLVVPSLLLLFVLGVMTIRFVSLLQGGACTRFRPPSLRQKS